MVIYAAIDLALFDHLHAQPEFKADYPTLASNKNNYFELNYYLRVNGSKFKRTHKIRRSFGFYWFIKKRTRIYYINRCFYCAFSKYICLLNIYYEKRFKECQALLGI